MKPLILIFLLLVAPLSFAANDNDEMPTAAQYAANLLQLINGYRAQHGMAPLKPADPLAMLAHEHCLYMAELGDINHDRFEQRYQRAARRRCVENVGWNYRDPAAQFQGWQASAGHNEAMLDPLVTTAGIAVFDAYVTFFACS